MGQGTMAMNIYALADARIGKDSMSSVVCHSKTGGMWVDSAGGCSVCK